MAAGDLKELEQTIHPTRAEVDLGALRRNYRSLRRAAGGARVIAVVKADAYGHGAVPVARVLAEEGAEHLAVAAAAEGVELRRAGIEKPILILGWSPVEALPTVLEYDLTPTIFRHRDAEILDRLVRRKGTGPLGVHVKVDTGMNRLGVTGRDRSKVVKEITRIAGLTHLFVEGVLTHFATADEADKSFAREQFSRFLALLDDLELAGIDPPLRHCANTAAVLDLPETALDAIRPGIGLYGLYPSSEVKRDPVLEPVMGWKTQISQAKVISGGEGVSYGREFVAEQPTGIVTLPVGYADGYRRRLSGRAAVLIGGRRHPVVGRVCMDQIMVRVDDPAAIERFEPGREVVLMGDQGEARIAAEELAGWLGTINYEICCMIGKRVPRLYRDG